MSRIRVLVLCAALAAALVAELAIPHPGLHEEAAPAQDPAAAEELSPPPAEPEPAWADEISARPLFFASRRPMPQDAPAGAADGVPDITLLGTAISHRNRVAVLSLPGDAHPRQVAEGESVDGWTVAAVAEDHIVLGRGTASREVPVQDFRKGAGRP